MIKINQMLNQIPFYMVFRGWFDDMTLRYDIVWGAVRAWRQKILLVMMNVLSAKKNVLLTKKNVVLTKRNVLLAKKNVLSTKKKVLSADNKGPSWWSQTIR